MPATFAPTTTPGNAPNLTADSSRIIKFMTGASFDLAKQEGIKAADAKSQEAIQSQMPLYEIKDLYDDNSGIRAQAYNARIHANLNNIARAQATIKSEEIINAATVELEGLPLTGSVSVGDAQVDVSQRVADIEASMFKKLDELGTRISGASMPLQMKTDAIGLLGLNKAKAATDVMRLRNKRSQGLEAASFQNDAEALSNWRYTGGGVNSVLMFSADNKRVDAWHNRNGLAANYNSSANLKKASDSVTSFTKTETLQDALKLARIAPDAIDNVSFTTGRESVVEGIADDYVKNMEALGAPQSAIDAGRNEIIASSYVSNFNYLFGNARTRDEQEALAQAARALATDENSPLGSNSGRADMITAVEAAEKAFMKERSLQDELARDTADAIMTSQGLPALKDGMTTAELDNERRKILKGYSQSEEYKKAVGGDLELQQKLDGILKARILLHSNKVEVDYARERQSRADEIEALATPLLDKIDIRIPELNPEDNKAWTKNTLDEFKRQKFLETGVLEGEYGGYGNRTKVIDFVARVIGGEDLVAKIRNMPSYALTSKNLVDAVKEREAKVRKEFLINQVAEVTGGESLPKVDLSAITLPGGFVDEMRPAQRNAEMTQLGKTAGFQAAMAAIHSGGLRAPDVSSADMPQEYQDAGVAATFAAAYNDEKDRILDNDEIRAFIHKDARATLQRNGVQLKFGFSQDGNVVVDAGIGQGETFGAPEANKVASAVVAAAEIAGTDADDVMKSIKGTQLYVALKSTATGTVREDLFGKGQGIVRTVRRSARILGYDEPELDTNAAKVGNKVRFTSAFDSIWNDGGDFNVKGQSPAYKEIVKAHILSELGEDVDKETTDEDLVKLIQAQAANLNGQWLSPGGQLKDIEDVIGESRVSAMKDGEMDEGAPPLTDEIRDALLESIDDGDVEARFQRITRNGKTITAFGFYRVSDGLAVPHGDNGDLFMVYEGR